MTAGALLILFLVAGILLLRKSSLFSENRNLSGKNTSLLNVKGEISLSDAKKAVTDKNFLAAENMLKEILARKPKGEELYEARFTLGYVYLSLNRTQQALSEFLAIASSRGFHRRSPDATFIAAEIYEKKLGRHDEARALYKKYVETWPQGRLARRAASKLIGEMK